MSKSNHHATNKKSGIECLEVLISKKPIDNNPKLQWTLSVYSLENQPVKKSRTIHNCEVFHFMVFDWERTLQGILHDYRAAYTIVQYFDVSAVYTVPAGKDLCSEDSETSNASALERMAGTMPHTLGGTFVPELYHEEDFDLMLDVKD